MLWLYTRLATVASIAVYWTRTCWLSWCYLSPSRQLCCHWCIPQQRKTAETVSGMSAWQCLLLVCSLPCILSLLSLFLVLSVKNELLIMLFILSQPRWFFICFFLNFLLSSLCVNKSELMNIVFLSNHIFLVVVIHVRLCFNLCPTVLRYHPVIWLWQVFHIT